MTQGRGLARIILIAAMIAGASYLYVVANPLHGPLAVTWKGAGVSLLAVYAALQARNVDGWLIALVMAFGAIGDVLLDAQGRPGFAFNTPRMAYAYRTEADGEVVGI